MKSPFDKKIEYNYDILDINCEGKVLTNGIKWESKKEFYNLFGKSEEFVLW